MKIILTGIAGFIGFSLAKKLIDGGHYVIGVDSINDYYDVKLKFDRLALLGIYCNNEIESTIHSNLEFHRIDVIDSTGLVNLFQRNKPDLVIHLAAQAGVRYSIQNPRAYLESNILGYFNVLDAMRISGVSRIIYASSSSVYGNNEKLPLQESFRTDMPVSFYAATKKINEILSESFVNVNHISAIGLRFFTVYGPYGRPDMAYYSFVKDIHEGNTIKLFNYGNLSRDFTYIDDIVSGIIELMCNYERVTEKKRHQIFNIGNSNPTSLRGFVNVIESLLGKAAKVENVSMQLGDVFNTYAEVNKLHEYTGFAPTTSLEEGLSIYISWFKDYYKK